MQAGDRPINCVKRATNQRGGLAARLRNALLDLSDTESSDGSEGVLLSVREGGEGSGQQSGDSKHKKRG